MYTDYSPPWSDSLVSSPAVAASCCGAEDNGLVGWVKEHPWLALGLVFGVGLLVSKSGQR